MAQKNHYVHLFVVLNFLLLANINFAHAEENASNPLAKVKNTDLRWQRTDTSGANIDNLFVDGAFMASEDLKVKYELHYWRSELTGQTETGLESALLKGIYFPREGRTESFGYRLAVGMDWIIDLGDVDKGIGQGASQLAPFAGIALAYADGSSLIPLVQHYFSYDGIDVSTTAFRTIYMRPLKNDQWLKVDAKLPIEWENDNAIPASAEVQYGKNVSQRMSWYGEALVGIGSDRIFDWGLGIGLRFRY